MKQENNAIQNEIDQMAIFHPKEEPNNLEDEWLSTNEWIETVSDFEMFSEQLQRVISPRAYPVGADRVSVQVRVSDPDGLHQVILLVQTREPHFAAGAHEVKACRSVTGDKEAIIEFDYDGVIPSDGNTTLSNPAVHLIYIEAIDTNGNVGHMAFTLRERSPYLITTLEHSTKDPVPDVSVSFSPDGMLLASRSGDGTVLLWDMSALGLGGSSQATFSLSLDGDSAAGDQAVTSLNVSPGSVVSLQVFGKDIQNADGFSVRFEYDATQVLYEGFDPGGVLPNAQVLALPGTNPTAIEISLVSFGGKAAVDSGLVGSVRFLTTSAFSGTTLRLVRAELGRGEQREEVTFDNTSVALQLAVLTPDFNGDGQVDLSDFLLFASQFGLSRGDEQYDAKYDLDGDGTIGFGDFLIFGRSFGKEGS